MRMYLRGECLDCGKNYHESWPGCPYCDAFLPRDGETDEQVSERRKELLRKQAGVIGIEVSETTLDYLVMTGRSVHR